MTRRRRANVLTPLRDSATTSADQPARADPGPRKRPSVCGWGHARENWALKGRDRTPLVIPPHHARHVGLLAPVPRPSRRPRSGGFKVSSRTRGPALATT